MYSNENSPELSDDLPPVEISVTQLEDLTITETIATSLFGDLEDVPAKKVLSLVKAEQRILSKVTRLLVRGGIEVIDEAYKEFSDQKMKSQMESF